MDSGINEMVMVDGENRNAALVCFELEAENKTLREEYALLLYEYWSVCDAEGLEWGGDIPIDPESLEADGE